MNKLDQINRLQQIAGINEGISRRTSGMRALQEGDETQELFNTWIQGQRETDNPVDAEFPEELRGDDEFAWERFLELVSEFPNADHEDISVAVSAVFFADLPFPSLTWNDEQTAKDVYDSIKPDNSIQEDVNNQGDFEDFVQSEGGSLEVLKFTDSDDIQAEVERLRDEFNLVDDGLYDEAYIKFETIYNINPIVLMGWFNEN